jgi:hypothetical protein
MKIHKNKSYLKCCECQQYFTKARLLSHFQTHSPILIGSQFDADEDEEVSEDADGEILTPE